MSSEFLNVGPTADRLEAGSSYVCCRTDIVTPDVYVQRLNEFSSDDVKTEL